MSSTKVARPLLDLLKADATLMANPSTKQGISDMDILFTLLRAYKVLDKDEIQLYKNNRSVGTPASQEQTQKKSDNYQERPVKKHAGDVEVVVDHYYLRPEVGVKQRKESPSPRRCWSSQKTCRDAVENVPEQTLYYRRRRDGM
ncbi:hypothetical protein DFJ58DRAFT_721483 [Suillus subalutaceus]|uniref:uncharacterized protein n=1 Tax=Suillus subalutaceus TaxID=48586 RepID=UPI001B860BA7|nr:uncharacterized protein DFJ58DRAFT_721483 [Suillus subalutaceus]KAG1875659.1 hypothetical protein DFJ58DRAFT_721483 [Suillus subalutaceus]